MFSKNRIKFIKSLQIKKFRTENQKFLVEGSKSVLELINSDYFISELYVSEWFYKEHVLLLSQKKIQVEIIKESELGSASSFSTNNAALAIVSMKPNEFLAVGKDEYAIVLDDIRDPGNLGTIIRIADWYGISKIICSETTTDFYNPKVISASMGSFTRIKLYYCDLEVYLSKNEIPIYGADMIGVNVHNFQFAQSGYLVMGNESDGISKKVEKFINEKICIPSFGKAESLNVAIAAAIICDNIRR